MNIAGKHPACPVLQSSMVPAGGRSRPGAAWVGRIGSTTEKSEGCNWAWSICECCGRLIFLTYDFRGISNTYNFPFVSLDLLLLKGFVQFVHELQLGNSRIQNTYPCIILKKKKKEKKKKQVIHAINIYS